MNALALPDPDLAELSTPPGAEGAQAHGVHLSALALIYLRHAAPARAMVLGLAAMTMGDLRPQTVLLVAESLIEAGDPEQALAVLRRFDDAPAATAEAEADDRPAPLTAPLTAVPTLAQAAARHYLDARALYRQNRPEAARAALDRAIALAEGVVA
ncbi:hypothetical protein [Paracoccus sanguinis]|uniref:hypothetical protein n=1 Tax=Paracoccus sanguinis TaxID=1545044 RepID=UPI00051FDC6F|nr:hypothetical protein [Paracoccus sanguinis]KGJ19747.1 hypothetical protein IX55_08975 [Paracoccus sanguinis]